jgi:glutamate-ammonia-ligase adenylyltransferase
MFQLIRGGVLPALQQPAIQTVLKILGKEGFVPQPVCRELTAAYRFFRTTEHRLQEMNDQQTHALPSDQLLRLQLARSMEFDTWDDYRQVLDGHRNRVRSHFDGLLEPEAQPSSDGDRSREAPVLTDAWSSSVTTAERRRLLESAGFQERRCRHPSGSLQVRTGHPILEQRGKTPSGPADPEGIGRG